MGFGWVFGFRRWVFRRRGGWAPADENVQPAIVVEIRRHHGARAYRQQRQGAGRRGSEAALAIIEEKAGLIPSGTGRRADAPPRGQGIGLPPTVRTEQQGRPPVGGGIRGERGGIYGNEVFRGDFEPDG